MHKLLINIILFCGGSFLIAQDPPSEFQFEQSTLQAFYFFNDVYDIQGNSLETDDWVAAFKGDVCVGARQWDLVTCGGMCDVPAMGNDGADWTAEYMVNGDIPTFKIYDASENEYFDANPSEQFGWENFGFLMATSLQAVNYGCTDEDANNYDPTATADDGTCDYGLPSLFHFDQSTLQAFYFVYDAYDINGDPLQPNDWVAAFNGEICVGARQWDLNLCQGGICDIPVMGDDGADWTQGYMTQGEIPTFKIYDASEDRYFDAIPSQDYPWANFSLPMIDEIRATEYDHISIPLHKDNNLISFYTLPQDNQLESLMGDIQETVLGVIGEAESSQYLPDEFGGWVGSLTELNTYGGYWIYMGESLDTLDIAGLGIDDEKVYDLHQGLNLISFPVPGQVEISAGIPNELEDQIPYIIGESVATAQVNGQWVGSLNQFQGLKGYWFNVDVEMQFSYDLTELETLSRKHIDVSYTDSFFQFNQSSVQSFYFVDVSHLDNIDYSDWIVAYHNDVVIGSRQWHGEIIDIPVMGYDGNLNTAGYPSFGDEIKFEVQTINNSFELKTPITTFVPNDLMIIESASIQIENTIPNSISIERIYPNPFNPQTTIEIHLAQDAHVEVEVYNVDGSFVETLNSKKLNAGLNSIYWNASHLPSGVYFIRSTSQGVELTQKVILLK